MAQRYQDTPNVLYEICNDPNGNVSWDGSVKPYAQRIIRAIRENSPKAVILVGSTTWSQDIHLAVADPLEDENLMYTLHFYAGTHGEQLRQRVDGTLAKGMPIFVSELGVSRADGSGGMFLQESQVWLDFLRSAESAGATGRCATRMKLPPPFAPALRPRVLGDRRN